jgi:hypothetical protein
LIALSPGASLNARIDASAAFVPESRHISVYEDRDSTNYELKGADVTLCHGAGTYIKTEYVRSDARQTIDNYSSDNGGLSFSALNDSTDESVSGDAIKLEARVNHAEVTQGRAEGLSIVWWKHRNKGFLVGIDRHINDHLEIGVGYNFTDFSDDLTDLDYQNNDWFLNFVGKR